MDKLEHYRQIIKQILDKYVNIVPVNLPDVENEPLAQSYFQLL